MRSHSVTCHPTQVNTPRLTPTASYMHGALFAIARPSVYIHLSVTPVNQSKTDKVIFCNFHHMAGSPEQGMGEKLLSSLMRQYLENGRRYVQRYY